MSPSLVLIPFNLLWDYFRFKELTASSTQTLDLFSLGVWGAGGGRLLTIWFLMTFQPSMLLFYLSLPSAFVSFPLFPSSQTEISTKEVEAWLLVLMTQSELVWSRAVRQGGHFIAELSVLVLACFLSCSTGRSWPSAHLASASQMFGLQVGNLCMVGKYSANWVWLVGRFYMVTGSRLVWQTDSLWARCRVHVCIAWL